MNRTDRKTKKIIIKSFDKIYDTAVSISKSWNDDMVSLAVLNRLIKTSKLNKGSGMPMKFIDNYNITLDNLYNACKAESTKSHKVTMQYLKKCIDTIKESFVKGLESNQHK
jgi:hypothetical protein